VWSVLLVSGHVTHIEERTMSRDKGKDKAQGKARGKKLTVKKEPAVRDLEPRRGIKAGAATRTAPWLKHAANHNQTLVRDGARKRQAS
jgi:hypothetical protein